MKETKVATTIYGIKNCDTMKKARPGSTAMEWRMTSMTTRPRVLPRKSSKRWSDEVGWEKLLNRAGTTFRKLPDGDKEGLNERKALALMLAQPSMIKRPVLEAGSKLLVGFQPEIYAKEVGSSSRSEAKKT